MKHYIQMQLKSQTFKTIKMLVLTNDEERQLLIGDEIAC